MRMNVCLIVLLAVSPAMAESACFRTAHEAAVESGVRDGMGFRLEGVRVDGVRGTSWATVRSCLHPEQPGRVLAVAGTVRKSTGTPAETPRELLVRANQDVVVVATEGLVRMELAGVAQGEPRRWGAGARARWTDRAGADCGRCGAACRHG